MDVKRLCLRMKLRSLEKSIVYQNALIFKHLEKHGVSCEFIEGYVYDGVQYCWHCWVQHNDIIYDYTTYIIDTLMIRYIHNLPENVKEIEDENITKNKESFALFHKDPKEFWRLAPKKIREFKNIV